MCNRIKNVITRVKNQFMLAGAGVIPEKTEGSHTMEVLGFLVIAVVVVGLAFPFFRSIWSTNATQAETIVSGMFTTTP